MPLELLLTLLDYSFYSAVSSFVAEGQESLFELWGNTVIVDLVEVIGIVNIVIKLIASRILILLLGYKEYFYLKQLDYILELIALVIR